MCIADSYIERNKEHKYDWCFVFCLQEAEELLLTAISLNPGPANYHANLGIT